MQQPMDYSVGKHRGFGFVEYNDADDAAEAIFNMDGADLMGSTIQLQTPILLNPTQKEYLL